MGYRHYMYIVPRKKIEDIRNLTYAELVKYAKNNGGCRSDDDDAWVSLTDMIGREEFFGFGKYYENAEKIQALGAPLFAIPDTQEYFEDYAPYVVDKDAVLCAIEHYRKLIVKWYSDLLMTQEEYDATHDVWGRKIKQEDRIRRHLENQKDEWENNFGICAIDTDIESQRIVKSWLYEYEIFELVHQFKMMDWETNTLVFMGW